jgi:two-component system response regulator CssR
MKKIYLVEDEISLAHLLETYLKEADYDVTVFNDGLDAKRAILDKPDLWILDIMLPGLDGYALIKEIKAACPQIPVIFMSARNAELDRVIGLEMGSDDYLPKPFLPRELVLRVNRILKMAVVKETVKIPGVEFDRVKRLLKNQETEISLTVKEFDLLEYFFENINCAINRNDILDHVWGVDYFGSERVIDDTLRRIRKKIPELPIETVYGFGYILRVDA